MTEERKIPIRYIGEIPCTIAGLGKIMPGQRVEVPVHMAGNLVRDRNWKEVGEPEAPVETAEPVEISAPADAEMGEKKRRKKQDGE